VTTELAKTRLRELIASQGRRVDELVEEANGRRLDEREQAIVWALLTVMAKTEP
jgi:hypothetical protein